MSLPNLSYPSSSPCFVGSAHQTSVRHPRSTRDHRRSLCANCVADAQGSQGSAEPPPPPQLISSLASVRDKASLHPVSRRHCERRVVLLVARAPSPAGVALHVARAPSPTILFIRAAEGRRPPRLSLALAPRNPCHCERSEAIPQHARAARPRRATRPLVYSPPREAQRRPGEARQCTIGP